MRYLNFIKMDEKHIPHFRRTELFTSGGGIPEGKEGEQHSHVRDVNSISHLSTTKPAGRGYNTPMLKDGTFHDAGEAKNARGERKAAPLAPRVKSEISRAGVPRRAAFLIQRDRSTL